MDAVTVLEEAAESLEPSLRARALALRVRQPDGVDWVQRGLYDPEPFVQVAVVDALDGPAALSHLDAWVGRASDPFARAAGAVRLGASASAETRDALALALRDAHAWELAPVSLAATAVGAEGGVDQLTAALAKGEIPLEPRFVRDLGHVGNRAALADAMRVGAAKIEPELVPEWSAAELVLGTSGPARAVVWRGDEGEILALLDALLDAPGVEGRGVLRSLARGRGMVADYARCILVARHEESPRRLVRVATSELDEVRALAMTCAGQQPAQTELVQRVLLTGLADDSEQVQRAAARAAQEHPSTALMPYLNVLASRDDLATQVEAAGAILAFQRRERAE